MSLSDIQVMKLHHVEREPQSLDGKLKGISGIHICYLDASSVCVLRLGKSYESVAFLLAVRQGVNLNFFDDFPLSAAE